MHREGNGHRPENRERAGTGRAAQGGYDVLGGAPWLQVPFLVSFFPETLREGAVPQHQSELMGRELFHEQRLSSSEELRGEVPLRRVNALT